MVDNNCIASTRESLIDYPSANSVEWPYKRLAEELFRNVDSKQFYEAREAKKIVNDYAVTTLPFVLLEDDNLPEGEQAFAAVYSEEGPITVERINEKIND